MDVSVAVFWEVASPARFAPVFGAFRGAFYSRSACL